MLMVLINAILFGALAGYIAGRIMKVKLTVFMTVCLGILGGILGSLVLRIIGIAVINTIGYTISAIAGACILIYLVQNYYNKK